MHTLSISPTRGQVLELYHLNDETYLSLTRVQPMPCYPRRPLAHGRQETKLQLNLGQRRWVTTSQLQPMFPSLSLGGRLIKKMRTSTEWSEAFAEAANSPIFERQQHASAARLGIAAKETGTQ